MSKDCCHVGRRAGSESRCYVDRDLPEGLTTLSLTGLVGEDPVAGTIVWAVDQPSPCIIVYSPTETPMAIIFCGFRRTRID